MIRISVIQSFVIRTFLRSTESSTRIELILDSHYSAYSRVFKSTKRLHKSSNVKQLIFSLILSSKCALRDSGCRIGYEPTGNELRSSSAVDSQGHQRGGFRIVPKALMIEVDALQDSHVTHQRDIATCGVESTLVESSSCPSKRLPVPFLSVSGLDSDCQNSDCQNSDCQNSDCQNSDCHKGDFIIAIVLQQRPSQ